MEVARIRQNKNDEYLVHQLIENMEIIGNIHDNPELLAKLQPVRG